MATIVDAFGAALMKMVRDQSIQNCDLLVRPDVVDKVSLRWKSAVPNLASAGEVMIPDIVDQTIFCLLDAIDNGHLALAFVDPANGQSVDLKREGKGELAGWHMMTDGWRSRFSKERVFDDFKDMHFEF